MKALIAVDGSESSFEAIAQTCRLLSPERDAIVLFYSSRTVPLSVPVDIRLIEQGQAALAESILTEASRNVPAPWKSKVERVVGAGDPAIEIVNYADECRAGLIAVGARGLGAIARMVLGSVSRRVVRTAKAPVLVVRKPRQIVPHDGLNVLVACESAKTGRKMRKLLGQFAWPAGSNCVVMTVVSSVLGGSIPNWLAAPARSAEVEDLIKVWFEEEKRRLANAREEMQAVSKTLSAAFQQSSAIVVEGNAASEILDTAHKQQSDLIVVGAKGANPLGRLFIGSTCESVLNHAPSSVLVIPHRQNA